LHRRGEALRAAQLIILVALWFFASTMDYNDQLNAERAAREDVEAELARQRAALQGFARPMPRTAFLLDARSEEELRQRLAEIAGDLDGERAKLTPMKPRTAP